MTYLLTAVLAWEVVFWLIGLLLFYFVGLFDEGQVDKLTFKYPKALWLLTSVLIYTIIFLIRQNKLNQRFSNIQPRIQSFVIRPVSTIDIFIRYFLIRNAMVFLIFTLAQPAFGHKKVGGSLNSLELIVCMDISNSMNTKDISKQITRLEIAKRALNDMINRLHGEKIGVVVFAGSAFVQLPLTTDYHAAKMFISEIETNMLSNQGTNINDALKTASGLFTEEKTGKAIMLVTDGENHEENPDQILNKIKEKNIGLVVLGLGTSQGGPIPINPSRPELGYKTDAMGRTVVSKLNETFISTIAAKANGSYFISASEFPDLNQLLIKINQMNRAKVADMEFEIQENRYRIPLVVTLFFWCIYLFWNSAATLKKSRI